VCAELPKVVKKNLKFVVATRAAIERAIEEYYAPTIRAAS
jgi:hypothetical protein